MARVFHDGFETGRPDAIPTTGTASGDYRNSCWECHANLRGALEVSTTRKSGNYSFRVWSWGGGGYNSTAYVLKNLGANLKEHFGRVEIRVAIAVGSGSPFVRLIDSAGNTVATLRVKVNEDNTVDIVAYLGTGTEIGRAASAFSINTWVRVEWRLVVDDTGGTLEVKRNGDTVITYSGDTKGSNEENVRSLAIGRSHNPANDNHDVYHDDIAINDTSGTVNNSWCGPGSVLLLKPKGAGNYTQFTPDSGNNFARVNEIPHTSDTAYVESATADHIDTYEMQTLADLGVDTSDPAFNIKAVQHVMAGRWDEAETKLSRVLRSGTTDNTGTAVTLVNTYNRYWDEMFDVNPFDSLAWGLADLNALEAGVKHIAST